MAIYRSDQAVFTFASEAKPGAMPERTKILVANQNNESSKALVTAATAGDTVLYITNSSGFDEAAGYVILNPAEASIATTNGGHGPYEVKRYIKFDESDANQDILYLESPLGHNHAVGCPVESMGAISSTVTPHHTFETAGTPHSKYITWIPGIYETIDCPDPEESFEARYMLGNLTNRNVFRYLKGQQTFNGAVSGVVLLNGWPLKYPIGRMDTYRASGTPLNSSITRIEGSAGDVWIKYTSDGAFSWTANTYIQLGEGNADGFREIRRFETSASEISGNNTGYIRINYPLSFDIDLSNGQATTFASGSPPTDITHTIIESTELPTFTWNVNVVDSAGTAGKNFQRRYYGGVCDSMTVSGEEGGLIVCDWDTVNFLGMIHNQTDGLVQGMRHYDVMQEITSADVGVPDDAAHVIPTTSPYYFHEGVIQFFGTPIARLRSFSLSISNSVEPRYYMRQTFNDDRGPTEIKEGPREYTLTATVALEDSQLTSYGTTNGDSFFKELLMSGDSQTAIAAEDNKGFKATLEFRRAGDSTDYIKMTFPNDGNPVQGAGTAGLLINTAPTNIDGSNPMEQNISMVCPSIKIEIVDDEPFYP